MAKLLLRFLASQPVEEHVHGFGPLWGNVVVDNSEGCSDGSLHSRRWLWMSHRDDRMAGGDGFAEIDIEETKLGLGSG